MGEGGLLWCLVLVDHRGDLWPRPCGCAPQHRRRSQRQQDERGRLRYRHEGSARRRAQRTGRGSVPADEQQVVVHVDLAIVVEVARHPGDVGGPAAGAAGSAGTPGSRSR